MKAKAIVIKPRDCTIPESFVLFLRKEKPRFNDYSQATQARIAFWIWMQGTNRRKHTRNNDFTSIGHKELESFFGRGEFNKINAALNIFDVIHDSRSKKQTRGYKLTEPMQVLKDQYLAQEPSKNRFMAMDGKIVIKPSGAIASTTLNGLKTKAWKEVRKDKSFLGNGVPVNLLKIERLLAFLVQISPPKPMHGSISDENIRFYIETLQKIKRSCHIDVAGRDLIPHRYKEGSTGRLYAVGSISLQNIPRIVKTAALHGSYDYDIENCHFAIFSYLYPDCPNIKHYLENKSEIREDISEDLSITVDKVKKCLLAVMFGAKANGWEDSAIPELLGKEKAKELFKHPYFKGIKGDVDKGRKLILDKWPLRNSTHIINVVGKTKELIDPETGNPTNPDILLAHLIQGYEVQALIAAIKLYPNDITLLMHDGFVSSKKLDISQIEKVIKQATGIELKMKCDRINLPSNLDGFLDT